VFLLIKKMYDMKKIFIVAVSLIAAFNLYLSTDTSILDNSILFNVEALARSEENGECKWKVYDCDKLFTGDYEACVVIGDGSLCTCGQVTRICD
jgi:hypothetical protein